MVRNNLRSFPEKWYVSMEFRVDSNEVHKSCGRVWGIKIEKSIIKSIKFRVKYLFQNYSVKTTWWVLDLNFQS